MSGIPEDTHYYCGIVGHEYNANGTVKTEYDVKYVYVGGEPYFSDNETPYLMWYGTTEGVFSSSTVYNGGQWTFTAEFYRKLDIYEVTTTVSDEILDWFYANATKI